MSGDRCVQGVVSIEGSCRLLHHVRARVSGVAAQLEMEIEQERLGEHLVCDRTLLQAMSPSPQFA